MAAFRRLEEGKSQKHFKQEPPQDASRLIHKPVDHFERERSTILHTAEKQKQMYKKTLENLQVKTKTASPIPFVKRKTAGEYSNLPTMTASPLLSHGRGFEQLQDRGINPARSQGHASSPRAPFSRYVPNNKLLAGGKPPTIQRRSTADVSHLSSTSMNAPSYGFFTPDVNATRRQLQTATKDNPKEGTRKQFLSADGSLRRAVSDRDVYRSSLEADDLNHQPLATLQEMRPSSPQVKKQAISTSSTDFTSFLDLLPSINHGTQVASFKNNTNSSDRQETTQEESELPDDYGMTTRLARAVHDIESRLADHHLLDLEDKALNSKTPGRPVNLKLPNKTKKYQTFMTLPPMIPIPWHLLDADSDGNEDKSSETEEDERGTEKERKRSTSFSNDETREKSDLAKQFEAIKHCRYLRHYKPNTKGGALF